MVSIREVAKRAGVSPATVSRVMNGTARVDEIKYQKVMKVIEETGFKPNELARALYKNSMKLIGVIVPSIENPYFAELASAVEEAAYANDYKIFLCSSGNDKEKEIANIYMLEQVKANGVVIITNNAETGDILTSCEFPAVVVDRNMEINNKVAYVEADHYKGGRLAAEHLIDCGCKKMVCMRGPQHISSGNKRYQGYIDMCVKYNMETCVVDCDYDFDIALQMTKELLRTYPDVDGIIACNDVAAFAVCKVLNEMGLEVPGKVQVVGFDDIKPAHYCMPGLTTVKQPVKDIGRLAVEIIIRHTNGESYNVENVLDVELIERQTTRKNSI